VYRPFKTKSTIDLQWFPLLKEQTKSYPLKCNWC